MSLGDVLLFAGNSVFPIILLAVIGYILKVKGLFSKEFLRIGNKTVFTVLLPVLLFINIAEVDDFSELRPDSIIYVLFAIFLLTVIGYVFSLTTKDNKQKGVLLQCTFRSNFALIGVPLAQLMAGDEGVRYAAMLSAITIPVFNILGVIVLSVFVNKGNNKNEKSDAFRRILGILKDIVKNPLIIGVLLGILFVALKPAYRMLPENFTGFIGEFTFVHTAMNYLAKASTPVALLVLGGQFELSHISELKKQITCGCVARLISAPCIGIGLAAILQFAGVLNFNNAIYAAFVSLFGTPVAVASAIMAEEMNNDGDLARQLVVWTTLFSAITIFIIAALLRAAGLL